MKRREFTSLAAAAVVSTALPLHAKTETIYDRILQSFPKIETNSPGFMVTNKEKRRFEVVPIESGKFVRSEMLKEIIEKDLISIEKNTSRERRIQNLFNANLASNVIAQRSLRSYGRQYAVLNDSTLLVWYKGFYNHDTPIYTNGDSFYLNPNYLDYFRKVEDISFNESDHELLKTAGFKRVI
jgi:hypothetical protein